uniref:Hyaluronan binding protein 4 n=1 Tax=Leptobrachium leishanense TaxID=445787 RepID=A0A8C5LTP3_9ANUR
MEEAYGCAVENRYFRLLDDESDPLDFLHQAAQEQKQRKKKEVLAAKKNDSKRESQRNRQSLFSATNTQIQTNPQIQANTGQKPPTKPPQKGNPKGTFYNAKPEPQPVVQDWYPGAVDNPSAYDLEYRRMEIVDKDTLVKNWLTSKGGSRDRGRGGVQRTTNYENQRGKREFERHSGSDRGGIRAEDKRGGSGSHNWGTINDTYSVSEQSPVEENLENHEMGPTEENARTPDELVEDFAKEMTLDEWKCLQDQNRSRPEFNLRKAASSVPSKAVVIHKSKFKNNLQAVEDEALYVLRKPVNDITAQLEINFGKLSRPARGGRGGGRGRGRREEQFSDATETICAQIYDPAPDPDDIEDFPALA